MVSEAYSFGSGEQGQLGLGVSTKHVTRPTLVKGLGSLDEDGAFAVAAAGEHSLIQMRSGDLLSCGCGGNGRLGHDNQKSMFIPRSVRGMKEAAALRYVNSSLYCTLMLSV